MIQQLDLPQITEELRNCTPLDQFWNRVVLEFENYNVTSILYGALSSVSEVQEFGFSSAQVLKNNHPKEYFEIVHSEENCLENDYSAQSLLTNPNPVFWHDETHIECMTLEEKRQWEMSNDVGMEIGVALSVKQFSPNKLGGIGLCLQGTDKQEFERLWMAKNAEIYTLYGLLDEGMRQNYLSEIVKLSAREKEVLEWLASGINPQQISDRLNIGYRTVDKYIVSAKQKLSARTRDHAVAKALLFNTISP
jgi:DNA-binding CsgD family transcriptional regulator